MTPVNVFYSHLQSISAKHVPRPLVNAYPGGFWRILGNASGKSRTHRDDVSDASHCQTNSNCPPGRPGTVFMNDYISNLHQSCTARSWDVCYMAGDCRLSSLSTGAVEEDSRRKTAADLMQGKVAPEYSDVAILSQSSMAGETWRVALEEVASYNAIWRSKATKSGQCPGAEKEWKTGLEFDCTGKWRSRRRAPAICRQSPEAVVDTVPHRLILHGDVTSMLVRTTSFYKFCDFGNMAICVSPPNLNADSMLLDLASFSNLAKQQDNLERPSTLTRNPSYDLVDKLKILILVQ
ncbi:hypothetical protein R3P38DRAFT_3338971 [Favolaschia claudopus]|uniref:Uncharacterized protein n=1 Tax=Favolaschia claudopus TaxID=2862362 RepID=A0AAW0EH13_9AGAR